MAGENLDDLINDKREGCFKRLAEDSEKSALRVLEKNTFDKLSKDEKEFVIWDFLKNNRYWDAYTNLKRLGRESEDIFSKEDFKNLTKIIIKEIMQGKEVAVGIPLYNDVWKIKQENSPLKEYVSDEHIKDAVNTGFWSCLKSNNF
ncbi:hypothetical protein KY314_03205, partial [Candidatus Woesearchaeota archaeon]|nr:hypothetical protein [Candidatus Woesearchaeota archaeon]